MDGIRDVANEANAPVVCAFRVGTRNRRQKSARVGMHRVLVDQLRRPDLHDMTEIHHRDAVRDVPHHGKIVGDEDIGKAKFVLKVLHQVHHLRLDRDVQGADGLIRDDNLGVGCQSARDPDALALAAGKFVRVSIRLLARQIPPSPIASRCGPVAPSGSTACKS